MSEEKIFTTVINKYPSYRDDPLKGCWKWLCGRRADDNAEGLWRVHDKLYNFGVFKEIHPGGSEWLTFTEVIKKLQMFIQTFNFEFTGNGHHRSF